MPNQDSSLNSTSSAKKKTATPAHHGPDPLAETPRIRCQGFTEVSIRSGYRDRPWPLLILPAPCSESRSASWYLLPDTLASAGPGHFRHLPEGVPFSPPKAIDLAKLPCWASAQPFGNRVLVKAGFQATKEMGELKQGDTTTTRPPPSLASPSVAVCPGAVFSKDQFPEACALMVFENHVADIKLGRKQVDLALWDPGGQEEGGHLRPLSYLDAAVRKDLWKDECTKWEPTKTEQESGKLEQDKSMANRIGALRYKGARLELLPR
ncbi:hypothetical protein Celaphus_00006952 [Cervus elaphus hippelaphus]|uniref:Uncharacterized protein n=1 Tax=Cervus elaphus hippelaphus TaxID=46360 RepID=A0A212CZV2_CEREH|nr:hypothetical protein Celaphus_00006952 [Cervus elaphus hippelaphus]